MVCIFASLFSFIFTSHSIFIFTMINLWEDKKNGLEKGRYQWKLDSQNHSLISSQRQPGRTLLPWPQDSDVASLVGAFTWTRPVTCAEQSEYLTS